MGTIDRKEYLPGALNALTGAGIILLSLFVDLRFSLAREVARPVGLFTVCAGMGLVVWAAFHLRGAFLGEVAPRLDTLVQRGPYRFVRHPVYLGMTVAVTGVAVVTRSWPGLLGALLFFLPGEIFRARLEEEALRSKFGSEWDDYASRTGFLLPRVGAGQMNQPQNVFRPGVIAAILCCYLTSALILGTQIGPWEAVREAVVGGLLALGWILLLWRILRHQPIPELPPIRWPRVELALLLLALSGMIALAAIRYHGQYPLPSWPYYLLGYGTILAIVIAGGYGRRALGLIRPPRRAWLGVTAVIGLNIGATAIYAILPPGEAADVPGADLAAELSTPVSVLLLFLGLLVRAALPEELVLRVGIQPRLARFIPLGWAIALQAVLFNTAHFPQQFIGYQQPLVVSIGYLLTIENGLMAGYLWYRTRSLPLLLVVHLFAFPRFGS